MKISKSFTLIELLVVIAIISGLSALLLPNFMGARERARDAQRKNDLKQIQNALELYKQDLTIPAYPANNFFQTYVNKCWFSNALPSTCNMISNTIYMNKIPSDPQDSTKGYYFTNDGSLQYTLCACLENIADSSGAPGNCDNSYICSKRVKYTLHQP